MTVRHLTKDNVEYWIGIPSYPVNLVVSYFMVCHGIPAFKEEFVFPNNNAEIFFNLGGLNKGIVHGNDKPFLFSQTIVSGLRSQPLTIQPGTVFSLAGVRFTLFGFQNLFGIPASEFADKNFTATEVWGRTILQVHEQLLAAISPDAKLMLLEKWIEERLRFCSLQDAACWNKLAVRLKNATPPQKVNLSELMGYSHKHTISLFKEKCGLSPKMIQKVFRFNAVLYQLYNNDVNWASLSYDAGYTDQSHFIKDFKRFTGFTPQILLQKKPKDWVLLKESR